MQGATLGGVEQDWLDAGVGFGYLPRSAEKVKIGGNDIVGVVLSKDDVYSRHVEACSRRSQGERNRKQH